MAEPSGGGGGGALVPSVVKTSVEEDVTGVSSRIRESTPPPPLVVVENQGDESGSGLGKHETKMTEKEAWDKDLLCPICMEVIKDAFLTMCGHNFCYGCISTHLHNKNDCPSCGHYLTTSNIYPNFLLNKLLKNASLHQIAKTSSPAEHLRLVLQQGYNLSVQELDSLIYLLTDKKRKREQEEAETNMQILLEFLNCLRKQKINELSEVQKDLQFIKADLNTVERHRMELHHVSEKYSVKLRMVHDNSFKTKLRSPMVDQHDNPMVSNTRNIHIGAGSRSLYDRKVEMKSQLNFEGLQRKETFCGSDPTHSLAQSGLAVARKRRIHQQFNELQECYLQRRRHGLNLLNQQEEKDSYSDPNAITRREGYHTGLEDFQYVLSTFTRYSRLRVIAELRHGDFFHSANIVSSIEFDRDNELFATAGVSKRIKVFEFSTVVNEPTEVHCPVVEMSTKSKLSCLSWNKYSKNIIASSDYEGIVTVWDVNTRQSVMEYEEHEKRAWSVDFSRTEPSMLVSGSDDCTVKIWCTKQETSVFNIDMKANICCVKYNPGSGVHVAIGSADHNIHYYDLRNISTPLHVFKGHKKAVSYVKFLSTNELASASTDSTLRLWDVQDNCPAMIFKGHTNEKNFVGLTVNKDYLACGSETNEVFVYQKAISKPAASHKFGSFNLNDVDDDSSSYFISAVCWKSDSPTLLTANSQGAIKVLVLAT